jgi:N-acetylmuramoyl-L-alanine amidase
VSTQASATLTRGGGAFRLGAALLLALLPLVPASARIHHNDAWARQEFGKAERMREALNGRPLGERTRREYQRVIDSYRRVYLGSPVSSKADPSVVASAELMVEMGRRFNDNKILRGAIDQYHFLRKEYPGSKYRFDALFTIGEIYKDDLNDPEGARTTFEDFLHRYPHNRLADDARAAVKAINAEAEAKTEDREHAARKAAHKPRTSGLHAGDASHSSNATNASVDAEPGTRASSDPPSESAIAPGRSALPRVTGVRHWSTPDYTRVAIDVEQEVKFGSQRISHPDRIFFDLRDTRLASTLVGKTFDVDDGFLKKIRVAEFQRGRTRIVLEVDDLASYDAFLLPDPYRLIIDIHGKNTANKQNRAAAVSRADIARTETANANLDAAVSPTPESDDNSREAASKEDSQSDRRNPQPASQPRTDRQASAKRGSDNHAVSTAKAGLVETDLPPDHGSADSASSDLTKPVNGIGVVKTTVAVKGSNHKIPKTIVEAEDRAPTTMATLKPEKIRPEAAAANANDNEDDNNDNGVKPTKSASDYSSSSPHRKKSRSTAGSSDTADLHLDRGLETREARPTASGDRSLTRALGLKIGKIVIDAGHGGHDTGTIGPNGLLEKEVVLDVAKRLGRLLEARLGAEVVYTRRDDTFIPLETRTAIANRERADLFISIHANSSRDSDARGVETYYLNFTSSPEALEVAARENAVSEKSIHELQDLVKKIALKEKIDESREFAGDVQDSLYGGLSLNNAGIRNRGIKKAPFIVLIGANMPSILAEISFVSNPTDERKMETSEHRQRIAESLYRGVSKYVSGLSGVKVASKIDKPEGQ